MPANLTPEDQRAEHRCRQATTDADRLAAPKAIPATIPKHKRTEKLQADKDIVEVHEWTAGSRDSRTPSTT